MKNHNTVSSRPNLRTVLAASGLAIASFAAGTATANYNAPKNVPQHVAKGEVTTGVSEQLRNQVQETAQHMASEVIEMANHDAKNKLVSIESAEGSSYNLTVQTDSNLIIGDGDFGQYSLLATVEKDKNGNFDPTTVSSVFVGMDLRKNSDKIQKDNEPISPVGQFYGFEIIKASGADEWRVAAHSTNKGPEETRDFYVTEDPGTNPNIELLTNDALKKYTAQAETVVDWSRNATPISYAPQA